MCSFLQLRLVPTNTWLLVLVLTRVNKHGAYLVQSYDADPQDGGHHKYAADTGATLSRTEAVHAEHRGGISSLSVDFRALMIFPFVIHDFVRNALSPRIASPRRVFLPDSRSITRSQATKDFMPFQLPG